MLLTTTQEAIIQLERRLLILFWIASENSPTNVLDFKDFSSSTPLEVNLSTLRMLTILSQVERGPALHPSSWNACPLIMAKSQSWRSPSTPPLRLLSAAQNGKLENIPPSRCPPPLWSLIMPCSTPTPPWSTAIAPSW